MNELEIIYDLLSLRSNGGVMIDVGAHRGGSLSRFADIGFKVHAFEPDRANRKPLEQMIHAFDWQNVSLDARAVSDKNGESREFFTSHVSTISSLSSFHSSHASAYKVETVTLGAYCREQEVTHVDVLKIDAEGHDFFALQGMDWRQCQPEIIMCEFEDKKTRELGYSHRDMAEYLLAREYVVIVSEWYPIREYGQQHEFRRCFYYKDETASDQSWGNILAFKNSDDATRYLKFVEQFQEVDKTLGIWAEIRNKLSLAPEWQGLKIMGASLSERVYRLLKLPAKPTQWLEYQFPRLRQLAWHHKGEDCFIVGGSSTLEKLDLIKLAGKHVIALDRGCLALQKALLDHSYLVACDPNIIRQSADVYRSMERTMFVQREAALENDLVEEHVCHVKTDDELRFANSFSSPFGNCDDAAYLALQIAYCLGFKRIFLVGVNEVAADSVQRDQARFLPSGESLHTEGSPFLGKRKPAFDWAKKKLYYMLAWQIYKYSHHLIWNTDQDDGREIFPEMSFEEAVASCNDRVRDPVRLD